VAPLAAAIAAGAGWGSLERAQPCSEAPAPIVADGQPAPPQHRRGESNHPSTGVKIALSTRARPNGRRTPPPAAPSPPGRAAFLDAMCKLRLRGYATSAQSHTAALPSRCRATQGSGLGSLNQARRPPHTRLHRGRSGSALEQSVGTFPVIGYVAYGRRIEALLLAEPSPRGYGRLVPSSSGERAALKMTPARHSPF
jgi:hypothetical protein